MSFRININTLIENKLNVVFLSVVLACIAVIFYMNRRYKKTTYYQITRKSRWFMDKGTFGEYLLYKCLQYLESDNEKFLFNIHLPKNNSETTEIDMLLINSKGLFIFENKNYGGWVFGNEAHTKWVQIFPKARHQSHKNLFYNPIKQNRLHIDTIRRFIDKNIPIWPIIVFSDRCTLKDITVQSSNVYVVNRCNVRSIITQITAQTQMNNLSTIEINDIYNKLYLYTQVSDQIKKHHIESIQRKF